MEQTGTETGTASIVDRGAGAGTGAIRQAAKEQGVGMRRPGTGLVADGVPIYPLCPVTYPQFEKMG